MKFVCDVHIPYRLINFLLKQGHEATHVNFILTGSKSKDIEIAQHADEQNLIVITKDEDFKNLHFGINTPKKLIRVLLGNCSTSDLIEVFEKHLPEIEKIKEFNRFYIEIGKSQFIYTTDYTIE
ncbi:MAG: DUF5615 family PIN-like protein [Bacteroidetes bacterium]|nr:DUF5615 family PIN-like protein [Bacteroidota bacterium]